MAWRVAKALDTLLAQINALAPNRYKASDGSIGDAAHRARKSDHNPNSAGVVTARDFTYDPDDGDADHTNDFEAHAMAETMRQNRDPRIDYVISNRRIFYGPAGSKPWVWQTYSGSNPHTKHVHVSVRDAPIYYDDTSPWSLGVWPVQLHPVLRSGSVGAAVKELQQNLGGGLLVDGDFGPKTEAAVKVFQKAHGLVVDGIVGPKTWGAFGEVSGPYKTGPKGIALLKEFEGLRLEAYSIGGIWHIGIGHSNSSGKPPNVTSGMQITEAEAEAILVSDLKDAETAVSSAVKVPLSQDQFDALVSLAFNKGPAWFRSSSALARVNDQDMAGTRAAILAAVPKPGTQFHDGLVRRRQAEANLFLLRIEPATIAARQMRPDDPGVPPVLPAPESAPIGEDEMEKASVPVKSPWASTINWASFGSMIVGLAGYFSLPVDANSVNTVLAALPVVIGAFTWVKNTWFGNRVLASSLPVK